MQQETVQGVVPFATAGRVFIVLWYEKGGRRSVSSDQVLLDQLNPFPSKGMQPN